MINKSNYKILSSWRVNLTPFNKKRFFINCLLILPLLLVVSGCAISHRARTKQFLDENGNIISRAENIVIQVPDPKLPEYEKLTYQVNWLGLSVGTMTISVKGIKKINDRDAYMLEATFKTNAFCSKIYNIQDRYISFMDVENLYTLRHEVYRREGFYKKDAVTDFDQINHKAHFKNLLDKSEKDFDIPPGVQDTVSACYYFMLLPLKVGDKVEYYVSNNEDNYQLFGIIQSTVFIMVPNLGEKQAFLMQPYAKLKGERIKKGKINAYFSCDKRRVPLFITIKGPIFTEVTLSLYKIG